MENHIYENAESIDLLSSEEAKSAKEKKDQHFSTASDPLIQPSV